MIEQGLRPKIYPVAKLYPDWFRQLLRDFLQVQLKREREKPPLEGASEEALDWLSRWIADANPYGLVEWLEEGGGWETPGLAEEAEKAFMRAWVASQRSLFQTRLYGAAERNQKAAELVADPTKLEAILSKLARADRPLSPFPVPLRIADKTRPHSHTPGSGKEKESTTGGLYAIYPGLSKGTPPEGYRILFSPVPRAIGSPPLVAEAGSAWTHEPVFGLSALKGLLRIHEWRTLASIAPQEKGCRWFYTLAGYWWENRLARAIADSKAKPLAPRIIRSGGRDWARMPKAVAGMSWAMGGQGVTIELDGHSFTPAPGMGAQGQLQRASIKRGNMPPGYALLPSDHATRPQQASLPIDMGEEAPPLAVAVAGATQYALSPAAGKLGVYILSSTMDGSPQQTSIQELAAAINPAVRRLRASHYNTAATALVELANLRLFMPNGLAYSVFYLPVLPWKPLGEASGAIVRPTALEQQMLTERFPAGMEKALADKLISAEGPVGPYKGWFLVDLTGLMNLPTKKPGLMRQYMRACSVWNAYWNPETGLPDPSRIPAQSTQAWAIQTNSLPQTAIDYLSGSKKGAGSVRLSEAVKGMLDEIEQLEAAELVKIDKADRKQVRLLPSERHQEAQRAAHKKRKPKG